uniref:Uncharacterized protein n=1 Tax=Rangifer tarandus platyrhynchus TaxID=3082113 RepID=A0ACB0FKD9_RANTA|nr:unnamed protein product [Rangifer tarandus platyrhynchus]
MALTRSASPPLTVLAHTFASSRPCSGHCVAALRTIPSLTMSLCHAHPLGRDVFRTEQASQFRTERQKDYCTQSNWERGGGDSSEERGQDRWPPSCERRGASVMGKRMPETAEQELSL